MASESGNTQERRRLNLKTIQDAPGVSAESVGMELRAIRLQQGDTVQRISDVLRIRKDMVEAIEHGRQDLLPGHAYAVGFVRAYSDYLRLDTADIVRRYKAELAALEPARTFTMLVPEEEQRFSFVSIGIILVCILAAAAGAWYLATQSGLFNRDRNLGPSTAATADDTAAAGTTPQPEIVDPAAAPAPAPGSTPDIAAPSAGTPPAATVPPEPVPTPAPPPVAAAEPPRPGGIVAPALGEVAQAPTGTTMGKSNADARIVLIARRPVMLTIRATDLRDTMYINRTLQVGDSYRVPTKGKLGMDLADAGAIDVMLDGAFIGHAGADGVPLKDFALSPEAYGAVSAPAPGPTPEPPTETPPPAAAAATPTPAPQPAPATPGAVPPATTPGP